MKKENYARKGFTLVELLIVIVVIGILSAMMMLSSTEAMSSAKASNIVSNLRNLKTATLAWYADHLDYIDADGKVYSEDIQTYTSSNSSKLLKYFNNENSITLTGTPTAGQYGLHADGNGDWYVGYCFASNENSVKEKLLGRAKSIGFGFSTADSPKTDIPEANTTASSIPAVVWMKVLGSGKESSN